MRYNETYRSESYDPKDVEKHYIRYDKTNDVFHFIECVALGENKNVLVDVRQGTVEREDLPDAVMQAAVAICDCWPSYVPWKGVET